MIDEALAQRLCGWIPPERRSTIQHAAHERALFAMPKDFQLEGTYHEVSGRFACWKAFQMTMEAKGNRDPQVLPYNFQQTGSCVGAGGGNMAKTLMCVEIQQGELEEYKEIWWPFTYGRSRYRAGMTTPGEGSQGSTWAEAATQDGLFVREEKPGLPEFQNDQGWLKISGSTEVSWSDGDAKQTIECKDLGLLHLIGKAVPIKNADEGKAALANGYPLTQASNFGTRGPKKTGNPEVMLAKWDGSWSHQTYIDEAWDHPSLGLIFRWGNNWGKTAHGAPTQGEPWGGFYIEASTFDQICKGREVFAFSGFSGFKVRSIDWFL